MSTAMTASMPLSDDDRDALIKTVYGEARGEAEEGQIAVVHVIPNRAAQRKTSVATECYRPRQFSCWYPKDPNCAKARAAYFLQRCRLNL